MLLCIYVNSGRVGNNLFIYKVCVCVHMYICLTMENDICYKISTYLGCGKPLNILVKMAGKKTTN